jgi:hypothetical protein
VHQDDPGLVLRDRPVVANGPPHEVVQGGRHLRARKATTRHDEGEHRPAQIRVAFHRRLLQHMDDVVADAHGVGERLERQGVLGEARDSPEVGDTPERHDQVIECQLERPGCKPGGEGHDASV